MSAKQREMSNLEYKRICGELQELKGARLVKIFELEENEFRFKFHVAGKGDVDVACVLPVRLHATKYLKEAPKEPSNFCMFLRKHAEGRKTEKIEQYALDRVVVFGLGGVSLVIELFSHGNILLLDAEGTIMNCYRKEEWKDRKLKPKEKYVFPASTRISPFETTAEKLETSNSKKIVAFLASTVNLPAAYLEEACERAGIPLEKKACELSKEERKKVSEEMKKLVEEATPVVYTLEGKPVDYSLAEISKYAQLEKKQFNTLSEALDDFYSQNPVEIEEESEEEKQRKKLERKLAEQEKHLQELLAQAEETKKIGDAVYENYEKIERVLKTIREGRKQNRKWEEIEKELKGTAIVEKTKGTAEVEV
ncbi:NFACT family protein [Candidatus Micrarchaeota archaeon]|nr:NFACT family protein [Candidatus Micrarchaeota archaeon]